MPPQHSGENVKCCNCTPDHCCECELAKIQIADKEAHIEDLTLDYFNLKKENATLQGRVADAISTLKDARDVLVLSYTAKSAIFERIDACLARITDPRSVSDTGKCGHYYTGLAFCPKCNEKGPALSQSTTPNPAHGDISLCDGCGCMTKTVNGECGKCKVEKAVDKCVELYGQDLEDMAKPKGFCKESGCGGH